ncbi:MAG: lipoate--protein ligase family protein [Armatimonadota bacterium]
MGETWRLIVDTNREPALNMAIDDILLQSASDSSNYPTLRLYGWERPAISIGHFQKLDKAKINMEYCRLKSIPIIRRPTGGRAVLHGHDITFSISLPASHIPHDYKSIPHSHRWLMQGIIAGLDRLGVKSDHGSPARSSSNANNTDCFAHIAECDIKSGSRKVVGSAQVRRENAILEQGSLPYKEPLVDANEIFYTHGNFINKNTVFSDVVSCNIIENAIINGYSQAFGIDFLSIPLAADEIAHSKELVKSKYEYVNCIYR